MKRQTESVFRFSRLRGICVIALACVCLVLSQTKPVESQSTLNIAAVVNDEVISVYDLSQRILLVVTLSNLPNTQQTHQRIAPDVLRRLIVEKLRLQEAKRLEIEVPDGAIQQAKDEIARKHGIPAGKMDEALEGRGIDPQTLTQQIRAELGWIETVRALFRRLVTISDQEVDDELEKMRANAGKTEYLLAEIFLAYDGKPHAEVENFAEQLRQEIGRGAGWQQLAQNFSQSASAQQGGDIGWNLAEDLDPALRTVVKNLATDEPSKPIAAEDGVYLLLLRDTRTAKGIDADASDITLGIQQLHMEIPENASPQTVAEITQKATELAASAESCKALGNIAKAEASPSSGYLGEFKLSEINTQMRNMVENLQVNDISQPLRTSNGVIVLMVCSRKIEGGTDPIAAAREQIERDILNRRLARMADQHEEKLRRQAFIDIRL